MDANNEKKMSPLVKYGYGLGDFSFTFFIMFIGYYLMYFLTDVIKFDSLKAASIYSLVQVFETIGIILGGLMIDRVHFKNGKFRPWMLLSSVVCSVFLVIMFTKYNFSSATYTIFFPLMYMICYFGFNFMWVAFRALPGLMTNSAQGVMDLAISSQGGAVIAALIYSAVGVKLLYGFGTIEKGYTVSSIVFGVIMVVAIFGVYLLTKPYDNENTVIADSKKEKVSLKDTLKCITGPMVPYFIANVLRSSVSVAIPALMVYYFVYVIGDSNGMATYLGTTSVIQIVALLLLKPLTAKFDKINIYKGTAFFSITVLVLAYFFGNSTILFTVFMALNNLAIVIAGGMNYAFITDIADYNEFKRGMNTRGFTVSLSGTANTCASLVGGVIGSFSLVLIGYDSSLAVQPADLAIKIRLIVTLGTALMTFLSLVPFLFYKLNNKVMDEVHQLKAEAQAEVQE